MVNTFCGICVKRTVADAYTAYNPDVTLIGRSLTGIGAVAGTHTAFWGMPSTLPHGDRLLGCLMEAVSIAFSDSSGTVFLSQKLPIYGLLETHSPVLLCYPTFYENVWQVIGA